MKFSKKSIIHSNNLQHMKVPDSVQLSKTDSSTSFFSARNDKARYWGFLFVILLSFFAIKPFFVSGFFPMHDDTQVARIFEMGKALKDGMFPVRWVTDLGYGYGYPIFTFYAPLSYYIGGFLVFSGIDALLATKITMIIGILLAGVCMYLLARNFWGELGGVVSGLFYVYATYHAIDIYVRGDISELWAYAFIPLAFLGFYKVFSSLYSPDAMKEDSKVNSGKYPWKGVAIGSLGYAGIILSHNLTAYIVTLFLIPFAIILVIFSKQKLRTMYYLLLTTFGGLLLSAFYWLPVPFEMKYTNVLSQVGGTADFSKHFVCISQFWYSQWGFGGSVPGCTDGISFMLGKLYILFAIVGLVGSSIIWRKRKAYAVVILISFIGWIVSLFFTTEYAKFIWQVLPGMTFLQYPWRFLLLASFFSSFLSGMFFWTIKQYTSHKKIILTTTGIIIILLLMFQSKLFIPQKIVSVDSIYYTNKQNLLWKTSKISDEYMPKDFQKPESENDIAPRTFLFTPQAGEFLVTNEKTQEKNALIKSSHPILMPLGLAYFPAWQYFIDRNQHAFTVGNGRISILVPEGTHALRLLYKQTAIEVLGNILSVTGFLALVIGIIFMRYKKSHEKAYS